MPGCQRRAADVLPAGHSSRAVDRGHGLCILSGDLSESGAVWKAISVIGADSLVRLRQLSVLYRRIKESVVSTLGIDDQNIATMDDYIVFL